MNTNILKKSIITLIFVVLIVGGCVSNQETEKVYRVGMFSGWGNTTLFEQFRTEMSEFGYIEGQNVEYVVRIMNEVDEDGYRKNIKEILEEDVDLLVSYPTDASIISKEVASEKNVPVLFMFASTEDNGLVTSLREPGNSTTGIRYPGPELVSQTLKKMLEIKPDIENVLVAYLKGYPSSPSQINSLIKTTKEFNITLTEIAVTGPQEFDEWVENYEKDDRNTIFISIAGPLISQIEEKISVLSKKYDILAIGRVSENETISGVLTYASSTEEYSKLAVPIADKILNGLDAGKIPVATPSIYLSINYKVAQRLGLNISEGILSQAEILYR